MTGYICLHRKLFQSDIFKREKYSEQEAWIWILANAAYKKRGYRIGNKIIPLDRGQLAASLRFLARKFKWTPGKVKRFLKLLKNETMIDTSNDTGITVISVMNYAKYNGGQNENDTALDTLNDTDAVQARYKTKKVKKVKKVVKKESNKERNFNLFWKTYPRRKETPNITGKKACQGKLETILASGEASLEEIVSGAEAYARSDNVKDGFVRLPMTWLNQAGWQDEQSIPAKPKPVDEWALEDWRKRLGPVGGFGAKHYRNNWYLLARGNFPFKCPPEILSEYWPDEEIAA